MCGIIGIFRPDGISDADRGSLTAMRDALTHRGPDDAGQWLDEQAGVAFAHRRLSILDLSEAGAQPMLSASGRFALTFNGEIYNFKSLRRALDDSGKAPAWRGHSDTEVLLAAIEAWGIEKALKCAEGMFALGLWDRETRCLTLARDRFGEKPLYVAAFPGVVLFASELKALMRHPQWAGDIDRQAIAQCLRHGYIPAPRTAYRDVFKLAPGQCVEISHTTMSPAAWRRTAYWDTLEQARGARNDRFEGTGEEAVERLDTLLREAVGKQMVSDVPLGAFLSGGIDSSTIAGIMQALSSEPVETFSLGFHEEDTNEAHFAKAVAKHLGTSHNEIYLAGDEARDLVATMPDVYDEPFTDQSQLPTYLISRFAREKVTVSLSGDAADELFSGYGRYHSVQKKWGGSTTGRVVKAAQKHYAGALLGGVVGPAEMLGLETLAGQNLASLRMRLEDKRNKFATGSAAAAYEQSFTLLDGAHRFVPGAVAEHHPLLDRVAHQPGWSILEQVSFLDMVHYLPDDILVKVDRAAMAHSLETRVPFLDPAVVQFAFSLPDEIRMHGGERKGVIKGVLDRYVPRTLWDRPKRGFGIPCAAWLKGPLHALAADMFSTDTLKRVGVLDPTLVKVFWDDFCAGNNRRANFVWALFVVQLYLERQLSR